jgi:hypothetical protein
MQDRLTFELSEFYGIFEKPLEVCLGEVSGLSFEVTVGPDVNRPGFPGGYLV